MAVLKFFEANCIAAPNFDFPLAQSEKAPFQYVHTLFISATFGIGIQTTP